jgi:hypothetical protein
MPDESPERVNYRQRFHCERSLIPHRGNPFVEKQKKQNCPVGATQSLRNPPDGQKLFSSSSILQYFWSAGIFKPVSPIKKSHNL